MIQGSRSAWTHVIYWTAETLLLADKIKVFCQVLLD